MDPLGSLCVIITNYQTGCTVVISHICQVKSLIPLGADFKKVSRGGGGGGGGGLTFYSSRCNFIVYLELTTSRDASHRSEF